MYRSILAKCCVGNSHVRKNHGPDEGSTKTATNTCDVCLTGKFPPFQFSAELIEISSSVVFG